ncbi:T9SS type B sorting domain-containing protein [Taibaiella koreensis]|uniref:T9SS type B sorting domain-containing protein n=1 Tax=Taibaiella koreensis TaxID=1268548 RepID=UPI000E59A47E|nr:gliding motility-associated C-terminal domain-containing protein [Taibaiella koreensis]
MRLFLLTLCCLFLVSRTSAQLIINEFSQGNSGSREYIELVVAGTRNCSGDSCMDIRGWIIDDNNGWCGAGAGQGIAIGHMRFTNDPNWSCVPYGSIILLYNSGDKNPQIVQADDPTDANNDHVYIVPSTSTLLEHTNTTPASPSSLTYVYPATTAYIAGGDWSTVGLANTGDAVVVVSPASPGTAVHAIAYGSVSNPAGATIYKTASGGARNYFLTNGLYTSAADYTVGNAPADETPGVPNGAANTAWINSMLANPAGNVTNTTAACILQGNSYNFYGTLLTASGTYADTFSAASGCDSIEVLHLSVVTPVTQNQSIAGCNAVVFNGVTYTSSTTLLDTLHTSLGCDSVYRNVFIQINTANPVILRDTVSSCQTVTYKGISYTVSQEVSDTIKTNTGCDSIYRKVWLDVLETPVITVDPADATICRGATITLTASSPSATVSWNGFPNGNTITVQPTQATAYVAYAVNDLNCIGTAQAMVHVEDLGLKLSYSPAPAERGSPVTLTASADIAYTVLHWFPENLFADQSAYTQTITAGNPGWFYVVGQSEHGCLDTGKVYMEVVPKAQIFIPTAFSPNGDGLNDYFGPQFTREYKIIDFAIFNRYGQRIYHVPYLSQIGQGWDGRMSGKLCDPGTYYYTFSAEDPSGKIEKLKGDLTLVR